MGETMAGKEYSAKDIIKWSVVALVLILWLPVLSYYSGPPIEQGPSSNTIVTTGSFTPGGVIRFTINTHIQSIYAKYSGRVTFAPEDNVWPATVHGGDPVSTWGDQIKGYGGTPTTSEIVLNELLQIPNNPTLVNKTIPIKITADLLYPSYSAGTFGFRNYEANIEDMINISIKHDATPISFSEYLLGKYFLKQDPVNRLNAAPNVVLNLIWMVGALMGCLIILGIILDLKGK
jgi:hypothetical protein